MRELADWLQQATGAHGREHIVHRFHRMAKVSDLEPLDPEQQPEGGVARCALWRVRVDLVVITWAQIRKGQVRHILLPMSA